MVRFAGPAVIGGVGCDGPNVGVAVGDVSGSAEGSVGWFGHFCVRRGGRLECQSMLGP